MVIYLYHLRLFADTFSSKYDNPKIGYPKYKEI